MSVLETGPTAPTVKITDLPRSLQSIASTLKHEKDLRPARVSRIIRKAEVQAEDLRPWADYEHSPADSYGRRLVYHGGHFEIMVMSWRPGDFSAIHDHGYTQWGAVQIFGPAEHATFRSEDGYLSTLARWQVTPGDIVGVGHSLIHQMGNPTEDTFFLSLHVYGYVNDIDNVTGDARVFDLENHTVQRVDGGVFFGLPPEAVKRIEPGPVADFPTQLRHMVELIRRLRKMDAPQLRASGKDLQAVIRETFSARHQTKLLRCLQANTDEKDHHDNSIYWRALKREMQEAARLQRELSGQERSADRFHRYAELYDGLIGQPCFDNFMQGYLAFFAEKYLTGQARPSVISLGCGTGLVEQHLAREWALEPGQLYGIDISASMVAEARERIPADVGDILTLDPGVRMWDVAYSGLNVYQYLDHTRLEDAIRKTAAILQPGGYFVGDFITPDHIRWYPNVVYSADRKMISLRTPQLIEDKGRVFQESEIINVRFPEDDMEITYAGRHRRFLPPINRVRTYFERAFGGQVDLYDAHSLELIPEWADSCPSTRYVVVAQKQ